MKGERQIERYYSFKACVSQFIGIQNERFRRCNLIALKCASDEHALFFLQVATRNDGEEETEDENQLKRSKKM